MVEEANAREGAAGAAHRGAIPSSRSVAYINHQTARKLLCDTVREMRSRGRRIKTGRSADVLDLEKWVADIEAAINLTVGG